MMKKNMIQSELINLSHIFFIMTIMAIQVVEFLSGGVTKLERFLHKNQHNQRKLLNFAFWINGELSKIGHHFSNKKI